jgi:hypothetical protein
VVILGFELQMISFSASHLGLFQSTSSESRLQTTSDVSSALLSIEMSYKEHQWFKVEQKM